MHKVIINDIDLSKEFIISESQYPIYSKNNIYKNRAENTSYYMKVTDEAKPVTFVFNRKEQCIDSIELQHYMEAFVATKLKTKEPTWIEVDDRHMFAILDSVSDSDMYQGKVTVTFMNLHGKWYSRENQSKLGTEFTLAGVEDSAYGIITVTPTSPNVTITNGENSIKIYNALTTSPVTIDLYNKKVMQLGIMSEIDINSDFFKLTLGKNKITVVNGTGNINYREVIAL